MIRAFLVVSTMTSWEWRSTGSSRGKPDRVPKTNFEVFYRFPMVPGFDTTFSYQAIFNPALDLGIDFSSAFSFRFRIVF